MNKNNPYSKVNGNWWLELGDIPKTEAQWRSLFAILEKWNADGSYVLWQADRELPGWAGKAATQMMRDANNRKIPNWLLPGGGKQIYIPTAQTDIPDNLVIKSTNKWGWDK